MKDESNNAVIRFLNVNKKYEDNYALRNINIDIKKGEFVFILGHSGAGKSTFMKMILREEKPTSGKVIVNGQDVGKIRERDIPYLRRQMGVVFQDFRLIPTMTAYDNVAFAMRVTNISEKKIKERVPYVLKLVGLEDKMNSYPDAMSGGEQQRIALARALVHSPQLIIADEPTGNIDPEMSFEMMDLLTSISSVGITVVVVTHEHELVRKFKQRVITIDHGEIISDVPKQAIESFYDTSKEHERKETVA